MPTFYASRRTSYQDGVGIESLLQRIYSRGTEDCRGSLEPRLEGLPEWARGDIAESEEGGTATGQIGGYHPDERRVTT